MNSYLFTWNPERSNWSDQQIAIFDINNGNKYVTRWSCGNTKCIEAFDRFFMMRLGIEPKGIIGFGYTLTNPYPLPHWDEEKEAAGKFALRVDLLFEVLSDEPIISLSVLKSRYPEYSWTPQNSGNSIKAHLAEDLFSIIQAESKPDFVPPSRTELESFAEGRPKTITVNTYDRSAAARQACVEHHGYDCVVCGFSFEDAYGAIGSKYIEVHHIKQIANAGGEHLINPITDLMPVCTNCHRMLHSKRHSLSIEELQPQCKYGKQAAKKSR